MVVVTAKGIEPMRVAASSPYFDASIPGSDRQWTRIGAVHEAASLSLFLAVFRNMLAMDAYQQNTLPFLDCIVHVKLAWKHKHFEAFAPAFVPGAPTTIQVMRDGWKKYADHWHDVEAVFQLVPEHRPTGVRPYRGQTKS